MRHNIFKIGLGVLMLNLWLPFHTKAILMPPVDEVYYYIQVDTTIVHAGFLRVDSTDRQKVVLDEVKGDYALWKFKRDASSLEYYIVNYATGDTLAFKIPETTDEDAIIRPGEDLNVWRDLFTVDNGPDLFLTVHASQGYYLTSDNEGVLKISADTTTLTLLSFRLERPKSLPGNAYYRIKVDTLGTPINVPIGYLSADTLNKPTFDSLKIETAINNLSLWKFELDTLINDTTIYQITNYEKGIKLAFDVPGDDTIASVTNTGLLNQWRIPFYTDEKNIGTLMVQDTLTHVNYYLAINPSKEVMLVKDPPAAAHIMSFALTDSFHLEYRFDSTMVYKIKYKQGPQASTHAESYLGVDVDGSRIFLDSVYAHIPDGQYVVNHQNTVGLLNRTLTGEHQPIDTLFYVIDELTGAPIQNWYYTSSGDTVEVTPITYGSFDKTNPYLGYKFVHPSVLIDSCHYFLCTFPDSLNGRILNAETTVLLSAASDTGYYLLEEVRMLPGAPGIGGIASLRKYLYRVRSVVDTTLFLSSGAPLQLSSTNIGLYFFKESIRPGEYSFVRYEPSPPQLLIIDTDTKELHHAHLDSWVYAWFQIVQTVTPTYEEPDPYTYLINFPDNRGKGFYELLIKSRAKWMSKNIYDYAVLGKEGESMLRAGSFTPNDLQLWVDTSRDPQNSPDKPSFYLVYNVDTTQAGPNNLFINGHFLHVMDSTKQADHAASVVEVDGLSYNRLNFVNAKRTVTNKLEISSGLLSESAAKEYRFYLQRTTVADEYYLVTGAGYGDGGRSNARGYLALKGDTLYVGPRKEAEPIKLQFFDRTVANEFIPAPLPPAQEEKNNAITIIGGKGKVEILNAAKQPLFVYNILGRLVEQQTLTSNYEMVDVPRGILIVKVGPVTRKIVVQ